MKIFTTCFFIMQEFQLTLSNPTKPPLKWSTPFSSFGDKQ